MTASLYARYKDWVRRNNSLLSVWETDRFSESEIALEAIHTAINLVSTFHDSIINECPGEGGAKGTELVFLLGALQQVQVLVELGASTLERQGRGNRYDALMLVEGLKALLRFSILYKSNSRILTNGGLTSFEQSSPRGGLNSMLSPEAKAHQVVDAFAQFRSRHCNLQPAKGQQPEHLKEQQQEGPGGSGAARMSFWWQGDTASTPAAASAASAAGAAAFAAANSQADSSSSTVTSMPVVGGGGQQQEAGREIQLWAAGRQKLAMRLLVTAELLHILRPLLYTMALRRWGRLSWRPWLASLGVDLLSWQLTSAGTALSQGTAQQAAASPVLKGSSAALLLSLQGLRWTADEKDELTRRKLLLIYYLLRDPLFCRYTGPAVNKWQGLIGRLPLAGWLSGKVVEILMGMQQYYTYTAAS
ncbi:hypothetical protein N2152v2_000630 [Parachlorella kessleri]